MSKDEVLCRCPRQPGALCHRGACQRHATDPRSPGVPTTPPMPVPWGPPHRARGIEEPSEIAQTIALVERSFAFVDLCGFTKFIAARNGEHAAIDTLTQFRSLARDISNRRGVMVAKWLGDGATIVGLELGPTVATAAELIGTVRRIDARPPRRIRQWPGPHHRLGRRRLHRTARQLGGAARAQAARPEELLAVGLHAAALPTWIQVEGVRSVTLPRARSMSVEPSASVLSPISSCRPSPVTMLPTHLRVRHPGEPSPCPQPGRLRTSAARP